MRETTGRLLEQLRNKNIPLQTYLEKNADSFVATDIREFWEELINASGKSKADLINKSGVSYSYFYDIVNGRKTPTFDVVIKLALAMHLTLEQTNDALRFADKRILSPRIRRDAAIIKSIISKDSVKACNAVLIEIGEAPVK